MTIIPERLAQIASMHIQKGSHTSIENGACVMELVSFVAGKPWSDSPSCASPVIAAFLRNWNDNLDDDHRDALLRPFISRLIGTTGSPALEGRRATMAADWLVRTHTPAWLRLAGLTEHADALASLPEITDFAKCPPLMPALKAAQRDANAAWDAARDAAWAAAGAAAWDAAGAAAGAAAQDAAWDAAQDAAWDAARDAAWDAAQDAAQDAAWDAARDAAWAAAGAAAQDAAWDAARDAAGDAAGDAARAAARAAARDAARDAAWDAARDALKPTVEMLQRSAVDLVNRMIDAKEDQSSCP